MNKKYYTYTLKPIELNILCILLFLLCSFLVGLSGKIYYSSWNFFLFFIIAIFYMMLHEVIHAIGFLVNKEVKKENVVMGMELEKGIFYCMCKQEISKKAIIISILAPLITIGFITLAIGLYINSFELIFLSIINISGAIGDIIMFLFIITLPKDIKYLDLDDTTSFTIISNKNISNKKMLGIKLMKTGNYDPKEMYPKDKKKIKISKLSSIIITLLLLLCLLGIIFL